jgi:hypothetical protein
MSMPYRRSTKTRIQTIWKEAYFARLGSFSLVKVSYGRVQVKRLTRTDCLRETHKNPMGLIGLAAELYTKVTVINRTELVSISYLRLGDSVD